MFDMEGCFGCEHNLVTATIGHIHTAVNLLLLPIFIDTAILCDKLSLLSLELQVCLTVAAMQTARPALSYAEPCIFSRQGPCCCKLCLAEPSQPDTHVWK